MSVKRLAHVCIVTGDLEAAERFYCGLLGLRRAFSFIRNGRRVGFYLEVGGGGFIEVFARDQVDAKARGAIQHICLEVDGIDRIVARLKEAACDVTEKKLGADRSWQAWVTAPDGVRIEFHEYTAESCQMTGADCVLDDRRA